MGEVYRARDTRLDRTVAIKILPAHLSDNPEFRQRFEREARAISSLNHPHICHLYDIGSHDGTDFLVMEFLDGETLAERLQKGALPLPELLKVGLEVAGALEIAHRAGIVHRDLKPGNIMLTKGGAKLMDFGLAKSAALGAPGSASAPLLSAARTMSGPTRVLGVSLRRTENLAMVALFKALLQFSSSLREPIAFPRTQFRVFSSGKGLYLYLADWR